MFELFPLNFQRLSDVYIRLKLSQLCLVLYTYFVNKTICCEYEITKNIYIALCQVKNKNFIVSIYKNVGSGGFVV